jgi:hypothetical protein
MPPFLYISLNFHFLYILAITVIQHIRPSSSAEVFLHLLIACECDSVENFPGVPRFELGPALQQVDSLYQLSYAAS